MTDAEIPREYRGWWRIVETSQWGSDDLEILGPALLSLTGHADRLRMFVLLAYVNCKPTKGGVSFSGRAPGSSTRFPEPGACGSARMVASRDRSTSRTATRAPSSPTVPGSPKNRSSARRATGTSGGGGGDRRHARLAVNAASALRAGQIDEEAARDARGTVCVPQRPDHPGSQAGKESHEKRAVGAEHGLLRADLRAIIKPWYRAKT